MMSRCRWRRSRLVSPGNSQNRRTAWWSGVNPSVFRLSGGAPACSKASTQSTHPAKLDRWSALSPSLSRASTRARRLSSSRINVMLPLAAAVMSGVAPVASRASMFAPCASSWPTRRRGASVRVLWSSGSGRSVGAVEARGRSDRASAAKLNPRTRTSCHAINPVWNQGRRIGILCENSRRWH